MNLCTCDTLELYINVSKEICLSKNLAIQYSYSNLIFSR